MSTESKYVDDGQDSLTSILKRWWKTPKRKNEVPIFERIDGEKESFGCVVHFLPLLGLPVFCYLMTFVSQEHVVILFSSAGGAMIVHGLLRALKPGKDAEIEARYRDEMSNGNR